MKLAFAVFVVLAVLAVLAAQLTLLIYIAMVVYAGINSVFEPHEALSTPIAIFALVCAAAVIAALNKWFETTSFFKRYLG